MSDSISKHDVINAILNQTRLQSVDELRRYVKRWEEEDRWLGGVLDSIDTVDALLSIEPERKKGKWIPDEIAAYDMPKGEPRGWVPWLCSECGWCVGKHQTAFCPSCGADMRSK